MITVSCLWFVWDAGKDDVEDAEQGQGDAGPEVHLLAIVEEKHSNEDQESTFTRVCIQKFDEL